MKPDGREIFTAAVGGQSETSNLIASSSVGKVFAAALFSRIVRDYCSNKLSVKDLPALVTLVDDFSQRWNGLRKRLGEFERVLVLEPCWPSDCQLQKSAGRHFKGGRIQRAPCTS